MATEYEIVEAGRVVAGDIVLVGHAPVAEIEVSRVTHSKDRQTGEPIRAAIFAEADDGERLWLNPRVDCRVLVRRPASEQTSEGEAGAAVGLTALRAKLAKRRDEHNAYAQQYEESGPPRSHSQDLAASALAWAIQGLDDVIAATPTTDTQEAGDERG